jgi:fimbrial isopeptide formation D2 family protein/LPXTG-motif cell wall-anchored protein
MINKRWLSIILSSILLVGLMVQGLHVKAEDNVVNSGLGGGGKIHITVLKGNPEQGVSSDGSEGAGAGAGEGVPGISFSIYQATLSSTGTIGGNYAYYPYNDPTGELYDLVHITDGSTDLNGALSFTGLLTGNNEKEGVVYFIKETYIASGVGTTTSIKPFFVRLPMTVGNDPNPSDEVWVYPKLNIEKPKKENTTESSGNKVSWEIEVDIPSSLSEDFTIFKITDKLDKGLFMVDTSSVSITYTGDVDEDDVLEEDVIEYFNVQYTTSGDINTLEIDMKNDDLYADWYDALANAVDEAGEEELPHFVITFDTFITSGTDVKLAEIKNQALFEYEDDEHKYSYYTNDSNAKVVGIKIINTKSNGTDPLEGAKFYLFSDLTNANLAVNWSETEWNEVDSNKNGIVLNSTGDPWVTDTAEGIGSFIGLTPGEYFIVCANQPEEYNKLTEPIKLVITETGGDFSYTVDDIPPTTGSDIDTTRLAQVNIVNRQGFTLPLTGGSGVAIFTLVGVVLLGTAFALFFVSQKKKEDE